MHDGTPLAKSDLRERLETYCSVCGLEAAELLLGCRPLSLRHHGLQRLANKVPKLVMVLVEQHHETGRLRVERRRDVLDESFDKFDNLLVGDGRLLVELVDAATVLDGVDEGLGGRHCG